LVHLDRVAILPLGSEKALECCGLQSRLVDLAKPRVEAEQCPDAAPVKPGVSGVVRCPARNCRENSR